MQEWKSITSYPNYEVGSGGFVRNKKTGRVLRPLVLTKGYIGVRLYHEGNGKTFKVHRLVALAYLDNPERLPQVNHLDGNKSNNSVSNLAWCTNLDNMRHAIETGLQTGSSQFKQKYSASEFRACVAQGLSISQIARQFGCKRDTVYRLLGSSN